jgi:hypothetical protein
MKSIHLMTNKAATTFMSHFTSFFHFSHSPAAITLNPVITVIIIAKKNAAAFIAESTKKNTFPINESVNHLIPVSAHIVNLSALKWNTSQNNQLAPYTNTHPSIMYSKLYRCFFASSGFLFNKRDAQDRTKNIIIIQSVISLITSYIALASFQS